MLCGGMGACWLTLQFGNVHSELIALFEDALSPLLDEGVEFRAELGHAIAQLVEAEIDTGKRVCHGGGRRRHRLPAAEA